MPEIQSEREGLATQTVKGSVYSIGASAITMVLGFGRSVLMARLLTPEDFGVAAFALVFLNFTTPLRDFGLDQALIHRKPDKDFTLNEALAVHFTLRLISHRIVCASAPGGDDTDLAAMFYPREDQATGCS